MKKFFYLMLFVAFFLSSPSYAKNNKTLTGVISGFQCGDNCYLTITDSKGKTHQALCLDAICEQIAEHQDDPTLAGYQGKKVKATVGKGQQRDGEGHVFGTTLEFKKLELVP